MDPPLFFLRISAVTERTMRSHLHWITRAKPRSWVGRVLRTFQSKVLYRRGVAERVKNVAQTHLSASSIRRIEFCCSQHIWVGAEQTSVNRLPWMSKGRFMSEGGHIPMISPKLRSVPPIEQICRELLRQKSVALSLYPAM